jgi:hypothetical protein
VLHWLPNLALQEQGQPGQAQSFFGFQQSATTKFQVLTGGHVGLFLCFLAADGDIAVGGMQSDLHDRSLADSALQVRLALCRNAIGGELAF